MGIRGAKSQLEWILGLYRVIIDINAYMLIFINKLTEITNISDILEELIKVNFRNFSGYFGPEHSSSSERSKH